MSIKYKMVRRDDYYNSDENKKNGVYPQVVHSHTTHLDKLALKLAKGKQLQAFDVKGTLEMLMAGIEDELLDGNSVCLDGFGTFSLTVQSKRRVEDADEIRAESIEVKRVVFVPSAPLRRRMKTATFVRSK